MESLARPFVRAFRPEGLQGRAWQGLSRVVHRVRFFVAFAAIGVAWLLPRASFRQKLLFAGLVGGLYLPYAVVMLAAAGRGQSTGRRVALMLGDVPVLFMFQVIFPQTRLVAMLIYLLVVAFNSLIGGLAAGATVAGCAIGLTALAQMLHPAGSHVDAFNLGLFAAAAWGLIFLLERTGAEQRLALRELDETVDALEHARAELEEAHALAHIGSWRWDVSDDVLVVSGELRRILGLPPEFGEMTSAAILECVHADDRSLLEAAVLECREAGAQISVEHRVVRPDDTVRWLEVHGRAGTDARGTTVAITGTAQDITERKDLEHVRKEFISMVTHDLRTPLTSIKGFAELIRESNSESDHSDASEYLSYIEAGASELESLTDQLLEYSRLESGRMDLSWDRISVAKWIGDLLEQMAPVLSGHVVPVDVAPDLEIEADPVAIRRVLTNLLQNAAKFSPAGTAIAVTARPIEGGAVFTVSDEGPGIRASDRRRVFEAFYRGSRNGSSAKGTGLGLAIAQRYVELHGGRIWIDEANTIGTTMSFELPLAQPAIGAGEPSAAA